jgi:hypothetical protein
MSISDLDLAQENSLAGEELDPMMFVGGVADGDE